MTEAAAPCRVSAAASTVYDLCHRCICVCVCCALFSQLYFLIEIPSDFKYFSQKNDLIIKR